MFELISGIFRWIFSRAALLTIVWGVGLSLGAAYLYYQHHVEQLPAEKRDALEELLNIDRQMEELRERAIEEKQRFDDRLMAIQRSINEKVAEIQETERNLRRIGDTLATLGEWLRRILDPFDREEREQQRRELEKQQREEQRRLADARRALQSLKKSQIETAQEKTLYLAERTGESETLKAEREAKAGNVALLDRAVARLNLWIEPFRAWFSKAWKQYKTELIIISLLILFGPILLKIIKFFVIAPLVSGAAHVQLPALVGMKDIQLASRDKGVSVALWLAPGETVVMKSRFLQASEEMMRKRTKFVFSWRYPITSLAAGLIELTRIWNTDPEHSRSVTISCQSEPEVEMALIRVPEGGSLILRPSMLAAVAHSGKERPAIVSHWRIFRLHSWLTLQFRYFEFQGPVRLVVWAWRGVRVEQLNPETAPFKRTNQNSTIGFTPSLEYGSTRAETFWAYLRGWNPLFDDVFRGEGSFLCQEIAGSRRAEKSGRFWESLWNGITKIFGI